jgi:hypothetical protein
MATEVDICNLALSHLGDTATVNSINPPDGSVQAMHCARFYPAARDELLEIFEWDFAKVRETGLAQLDSAASAWAYAYALPADTIKVRFALPEGATDDTLDGIVFMREGDTIYSHEPISELITTKRITNTTKFSPLFNKALAIRLAMDLVGPLRKAADPTIRQTLNSLFNRALGDATTSNGNVGNDSPERRQPSHLAAR